MRFYEFPTFYQKSQTLTLEAGILGISWLLEAFLMVLLAFPSVDPLLDQPERLKPHKNESIPHKKTLKDTRKPN